MSSATKTRISAILPARLSAELRKVALAEQVPQSRILAEALQLWLRQRLDRETKELSRLTFDDLPSEQDWLSVQSVV
jgi:hypothetical protein